MREFVQLGYATTEHGNQGVTTDESITLVTGTTTGRGLYVGRSSNLLDEIEAALEPVRKQRHEARVAHGDAAERLNTHDRQVAELKLFRQDDTGLTGAVDTWRRWAAGHPMASAGLDAAAYELSCYVATTSEARALLAALAPDHPALHQQARAFSRTEVDYGIEL